MKKLILRHLIWATRYVCDEIGKIELKHENE